MLMAVSNDDLLVAIQELAEQFERRIEAVRSDLDHKFDALRAETRTRLDRIEQEQRQIKELYGILRQKDVLRLDHRIDQVALDNAGSHSLSRRAPHEWP